MIGDVEQANRTNMVADIKQASRNMVSTHETGTLKAHVTDIKQGNRNTMFAHIQQADRTPFFHGVGTVSGNTLIPGRQGIPGGLGEPTPLLCIARP